MQHLTKEEAREIIAKACGAQLEANGYELVDALWNRHRRGSTVQLFIHREGGATIGDCQKAHKMAQPLLQAEGILDERGSLEVASPGLDRPLRTPADFRRAAGHAVSLRRRKAKNPDEEENVRGIVQLVNEKYLALEDEKGKLVLTELEHIIVGKYDLAFQQREIEITNPYYGKFDELVAAVLRPVKPQSAKMTPKQRKAAKKAARKNAKKTRR